MYDLYLQHISKQGETMRLYEKVVEFESTGVKFFRVNGENIHFVES